MDKHKVSIFEFGKQNTVRNSTAHYLEDPETGNWKWDIPEILDESQIAEWNRIMSLLSNVNGEDLRSIVCGVGLMDHCLNSNDFSYID